MNSPSPVYKKQQKKKNHLRFTQRENIMSNLVLILSEGALATATWTATVRESATLQTRADFSATWTGEYLSVRLDEHLRWWFFCYSDTEQVCCLSAIMALVRLFSYKIYTWASATWTGSLYWLPKYSAFPTIFDSTSPFFSFSLQTSTLLTVLIYSSDSTCGDLRAQYFFVWGVSRQFNTNILRSKVKRFP